MKHSLFIVVALAALALSGCGDGGFKKGNDGASANVLRYPIPNKPTTLDPGVVQDGDTIDALQQVFEGLVGWNENNEPTGILAEKWDFEQGGKVIVFHIKKGVKFHNGRELKAEDFKWSWERVCAPDLKSTNGLGYMTDIMGVQELLDGKAKEISGVKVVDDYMLRVELTAPRPYFLGKLTYLAFAAVAKEAQDGLKEMSSVKQMIGTGPFKAESYVPEQLLTMVANKDYHGGAPLLDKIERPVVLDPQTRLNKFKKGEVELCLLQRADVESVNNDSELKPQLVFLDRPSIFYVAMNCSGSYPPFKDRRVRRAFAMAIDRKKIVETYMKGVNKQAHGIIPPGVFGNRPGGANEIPFDPEGAKKLLAEAGYPGGKGMPELEIRYRESYRDISLVAEAVSNDINKTLGVKVNNQAKEWKAYLDLYNKGENRFYHMRWAADYLDPQNFISHMLATYGPENHTGYSNPVFDKICRDADSIMDQDKRANLYQQAEDIVLQDAIWVPIYFQRDAELQSSRVKGMRESLFGHLPHTKTTLK
ncbi:MAG: ABC transporter substrate-binding protein [Fimbriimonadaceae bacterium]